MPIELKKKGMKFCMEILKVENLSKLYGENDNITKALDNITFSAQDGEFIAIIGASGSGKSTLLHILGGIDKPSSGRIIVNGQDISNLSDRELAVYRRRTASLVFQFYNLIPILNVKENITLPIRLDNKKVDDEKLEELIKILGLTDKQNKLPNQLSGGEQQRVAIGRALMCETKILLADEPTGNLDSKNSIEIVKLIKEYNEKYNQTIILVTHDIEVAKQAGRIITLQDGKIVRDEVQ